MANARTTHLLIVEDDAPSVHLIELAFANRRGKTRWELSVAKDGQEALQMLFNEEQDSMPLPDLILLDWNLPRVSGDEVLRRLNDDPKLRRIPVLVFSSSSDDRDIHAAYDAHANGYITKPMDMDVLAMIVAAIEHFWVAVAEMPKVARGKSPAAPASSGVLSQRGS